MQKTSGRKMFGLLAALVAAALLTTAAIGAGSTLADRGGNGKGHFSSLRTADPGACSVTPNSSAQWELNTISGSGFGADGAVSIAVRSAAGDVAVGGANTDATGSFSTIWQAVWLGTNTVTVSDGNAMATCSFDVY